MAETPDAYTDYSDTHACVSHCGWEAGSLQFPTPAQTLSVSALRYLKEVVIMVPSKMNELMPMIVGNAQSPKGKREGAGQRNGVRGREREEKQRPQMNAN